MNHSVSQNESLFYSRHFLLNEVGQEGQLKLKQSKVICIGAGGLGCPALLYLAAMGIGQIGIVDDDVVDMSNLHRQILYTIDDVGKKKVEIAKQKLSRTNPFINITAIDARASSDNILRILAGYDAVLDCSDNFATRYLVNDACFRLKIPLVFGAISKFSGMCSVFCSPGGPCYRCLYPEPLQQGLVLDCAEAGVLGVLPGLVGTLQAIEALKLILGIGVSLKGSLLRVDALTSQFANYSIPVNPECILCAKNQPFEMLPRHGESCKIQQKPQFRKISPIEFKELLKREDVFLLDVRNPDEFAAFNIGGHLIPLHELISRKQEIPSDKVIVALCHSGIRSVSAIKMLQEHSDAEMMSLDGGLAAFRII